MKKKIKTYEYTIAEHYAPALINGDHTGLEDNESRAVDQFEQWVIKEHGYGHWSYRDNADAYFDRCDVCELMANCVPIEWVVM